MASRAVRNGSLRGTGPALAALVAFGALSLSAGSAEAVVYCRTAGVPQGCVARPVAAPVAGSVAAPGAGARGVGVRPGTPVNRGGPVNRVGRR
jgi:hypothetical protein